MDEMETAEKSSEELGVTIISNDQVSEVSKSSHLLPTATVFIKEELFRDFDNVNETSQDDDVTEMHDSYITIDTDKSKSDEEDDDEEDDDNDCDGDDDNAIFDDDEDEDQNDNDDEADEEEIDESDLNISAWPVAVKLQTVGDNVITIDDTDASDENDSSSSRSPSIKRKKLSRTRKKRSAATPYFCRLCNTKFGSEILLTVHLHTSHKGNINVCGANNKFTCLLCKAVLGSKSLLHAHMTRVHTEKKIINCTKCNKGFKYRSYLTVNSYNKRSKPHCDKEYYRNFTCFHCSVNKS